MNSTVHEPTPDVHYYCQECGTWYNCDDIEMNGHYVVSQKCCGKVIQDAYEWNIQTPWMKWQAGKLLAERAVILSRLDEIEKELRSRWLCDV